MKADYRPDRSYYRVYYKKSINNGVSWSSDMLLSDDNSQISNYPQIEVSNNKINVVWDDARSTFDIFYKYSDEIFILPLISIFM